MQSDVLELNQARLGKSLAEIQRNTGSRKVLVGDNADRTHQLASSAALQRVYACADKARQLSIAGKQVADTSEATDNHVTGQ